MQFKKCYLSNLANMWMKNAVLGLARHWLEIIRQVEMRIVDNQSTPAQQPAFCRGYLTRMHMVQCKTPCTIGRTQLDSTRLHTALTLTTFLSGFHRVRSGNPDRVCRCLLTSRSRMPRSCARVRHSARPARCSQPRNSSQFTIEVTPRLFSHLQEGAGLMCAGCMQGASTGIVLISHLIYMIANATFRARLKSGLWVTFLCQHYIACSTANLITLHLHASDLLSPIQPEPYTLISHVLQTNTDTVWPV